MPFEPKNDIPSLSGKVILITGGNAGLGKAAVTEFARHKPAEIWLTARSLDKAQAAADEIKQHIPHARTIRLLKLDLASFDSIKDAAKTFTSSTKRLDILMLNAGVMATPPGQTSEGYELQFGENHMGHALLTKLLVPVLQKTAQQGGAEVRVVSVSSLCAGRRAPVRHTQNAGGHINCISKIWPEQAGQHSLDTTTGCVESQFHRCLGSSGGGEDESSVGCDKRADAVPCGVWSRTRLGVEVERGDWREEPAVGGRFEGCQERRILRACWCWRLGEQEWKGRRAQEDALGLDKK